MGCAVRYEEATIPLSIAGTPATPAGFYRLVKLVIEWLAAAMLLLLAAPLVGALALIVRWASPGPAFYSQVRLGKDGRRFRIYKLRTMLDNCEAQTGPVWACANDPRVTPLGRFLRDTHLDELPQLWNVLRGEMGLIGPRPERPEIAQRISDTLPEFPLRLQIRPGLTGLAQLRTGPDSTITQVFHKLTNDLYYIQNLSLLMDIRISAATFLDVAASFCGGASRFLLNMKQTQTVEIRSPQLEQQPADEAMAELVAA
jgi:lipopolysaccharide/colanic/teichoic acid biosynthesis glycosyltransferase